MPEKTREEFTADGYFITGDMGSWDADFYISISGRDVFYESDDRKRADILERLAASG